MAAEAETEDAVLATVCLVEKNFLLASKFVDELDCSATTAEGKRESTGRALIGAGETGFNGPLSKIPGGAGEVESFGDRIGKLEKLYD